MSPRYSNVRFDFLSADEDPESPNGTVIVRGNEMILEVELAGDRPYVIKGRSTPHGFHGKHDGQTGDVPVTATWADIGGEYVGVWIQEGKDYLFRFRLGKADSGTGTSKR